MARLARITTYPIKSLDPVERDRARLVTDGALDGDREYAVVNENDRYVNGKRTADVHRVRASFDDDLSTVALGTDGTHGARERTDSETKRFDFESDRTAIDEWLSEHFEMPAHLKRDATGGFPDDTTLSGPTLVSAETPREVASWFPDIDVEGMRRRLRANLEVDGVSPFWEDRLVADYDHCVAFRVGDVTFRGVNPCQRCVVPTRDPYTGETNDGFQRTFVEKREETLPEWANRSRFDPFFRLMVNTQIPESEWESEIAVGDGVTILGERAFETAE